MYSWREAEKDYMAELRYALEQKSEGETIMTLFCPGISISNCKRITIDKYIEYWASKLSDIKNRKGDPSDYLY